jgi:hypothetical protein
MNKNPRTRGKDGFALIVTLSLMILLTVVAVGLLTLSSISLRSTSQGAAQAIANGNARLAMILALGELQASMGPDRAVSAPAAAVMKSAARPQLTGAWNALDDDYWRWVPGTGAPSYSRKKERFQRWLVSSAEPTDAEDFDYVKTALPAGTDVVNLVGNAASPLTDSEGNDTTVLASKVKLARKTLSGKFGWAVFDESTKAAIDLGDPSSPQDRGGEIASRSVPPRLQADAIDASLEALKNPSNLVSLETAKLKGDATFSREISKRFHDFTTGTLGLLTDTAMGGLKTDLTQLFEPNSLPGGAFVTPSSVSPYPSTFGIAAGAPKWAYIRDHYRKYKFVTTDTNGEPTYVVNNLKVNDLKINSVGTTASPDFERLLPVVAKFQMMFSLVSHYAHLGDRVQFLNANGGNTNFAIPHLVYDPVITLYNPYDVTISLAKVRIRVWDPPVGFRFSKIDKQAGTTAFFREGGEFQGLARFQIANQGVKSARRCFTLVLTDGTSESAGGSLKLKPGEVKVFSPRVQNSWSWQWETTNGPNVFFDYDQGREFANRDGRTGNPYGIEAVPGWDFRAGLQEDHLARNDPRYDASRYPFERAAGKNDGFVTMRMTDEVVVEVKPMVTSENAAKQFQVDILAGNDAGSTNITAASDSVKGDRLRSYFFTFTSKEPSEELSTNPTNPIIKANYLVKDILQSPSAKDHGLKKPFAMLEMTARTTRETTTDSKPWLYNNPVIEGADQNTGIVGLAHQSYDLRLIKVSSPRNFPDGISIDDETNRGYFGAYGALPSGSSFVNMLHVPLAPAASLGNLIHTNLISGSVLPRVVHPFGNSRAHPLIPASAVVENSATRLLDHSYLLNDALWDRYFFSSLTDYEGGTGKLMPTPKPMYEVLTGMFEGSEPALNSRIVPVTYSADPSKAADEVRGLSDLDRSRQMAKYVAVRGPFNVNSVSVDAWRAVLLSLRDREINGLQGTDKPGKPVTTTMSDIVYRNDDATPFVRAGKPISNSTPPAGLRWAGYRALTDEQIKNLARLIVEEIRESGSQDSAPPFSVGEFVNRRISPVGSVHSLAGILQTAIDRSDINEDAISRDSRVVSFASISSKRTEGVQTSEVMDGNSAEGAPSMLTQGDLLTSLAPIITVRGDTFKIRSYGEAIAADGKTVTARSWCEAIVQRLPEFVDSRDLPETPIDSLTSDSNKTFGRRFHVVSFRWLKETEL